MGSGAATTLWNAWIAGGSGSAGSASVILPASSTSTFSGSASYGSGSNSNYASAGMIVMEIRGEYINGLGSNFSWIRPVASITTASGYMSLVSMAFDSGCEAAALYDFNSSVGVGFVVQETDSF
jgi:hypothetical protein